MNLDFGWVQKKSNTIFLEIISLNLLKTKHLNNYKKKTEITLENTQMKKQKIQ